jgi:D-glycero-D-manno-heptose 1,7-bisphosphate phosphatase
MTRKAVFLDRDGVINTYVYNAEFGTVDSPSCPEEFTFSPGAEEAIALLKQLGYLVIVVSNQPGIAKGRFSAALLQSITDKMHAGIEAHGGKLDAVYYCLHHPEAVLPEYRIQCECRKPRPGMLIESAREWDIDLSHVFMIGDGITDIEAGRAAGTRTIFIGQPKSYILDEFDKRGIAPDFFVSSLMNAARTIQQLEDENRG